MATVTHTIYSRYAPKQRTIPEPEIGDEQTDRDLAEDAAWTTESTFAARRALTTAPRFVPATISYDDWGSAGQISTRSHNSDPGKDLAGWYKSLTATDTSRNNTATPTHNDSNSSLAKETSNAVLEKSATQPRLEKRTKNNWFIMKAIQSEPTASSSTSPSTIADILARDPPPLPSDKQYTPPVWLALGPSNKGFAMLQQSGWNEGEALGRGVRRGKPVTHLIPDGDSEMISTKGKGKRKADESPVAMSVKKEEFEVKCGTDNDICEIRKVDVIDLTMSDSGSETDDDDGSTTMDSDGESLDDESTDLANHGGTALLTPIPTILKSDRLGIGLKAKTIRSSTGFRAPKKRVTHNAAAMAAHIRAAEETRKKKQEVGRGRRGFQRLHRKEEAERKRMLAYLNE